MEKSFEEALSAWLKVAQERVDQHYAGSPFELPKLTCEHGKRYVRVVRNDGTSRSAHAFIDTTNGDVLKPDGWKRPAKGARGNIYTGRAGVTGTGGEYRR